MRRRGAALAMLAALAGCGGTTDPSRLPSPGTVIHLLEEGNKGNVAVTADGATDPWLRPHVYPLSPVQTAHALVDALDSLPRWEVVAGKDGVIWATRRTRLFRFVDDIYLLLLPAHDSTVVFARSASRLGRGDLGQNRRNLGELWAAMERRVNRPR